MQRTIFHFVACCLLALAGCSRNEPAADAASPTPSPTAPAQPPVDACALLTSDEIASVQGEPYQETKPSVYSPGGLTVSQCYFALPTASHSVVLSVTQTTPANAPVLRKQWDEMVNDPKGKKEEGESGKEAPRREFPGLGEQAFWEGSAVGGALYVLQGNTQIRISVGGPGDNNAKIDRSEALARIALGRLSRAQQSAPESE